MKLLVALPRFPYPTLKGDKLRAYYLLRELSQRHEVHLVCTTYEAPSPEDLAAIAPLVKSLTVIKLNLLHKVRNLAWALFTGLPFQAAYFRSGRAKRAIAQVVGSCGAEAMLVQLVRTTENIPHTPGIRRVLDYMDAMSAGMQKRVELSPRWFRPIVAMEARRLARYEAKVAAQYDALVTISEADRLHFPRALQAKIAVVPNGLPNEFASTSRLPLAQRTTEVVFTGNMSYHPNVKAAEYLARQVMPLVWANMPQARLRLVGTHPTPEVKALQSERVAVTGFVPSIQTELAQSHVFAAPLFSGAGLQNKLLEAMGVGIPCVTTPLCNGSLGAAPGTEILIADSAQEFANAILGLLQNPEMNEGVGLAGKRFVSQRYQWPAVAGALELILTGRP
jgi:sugar transferase (PEP-CTERM/EpsH1 system associated)